MIEFFLKDGRYAVRLGRITMSQSAFVMISAIAVGVGGGYGAVLFRALIRVETWVAFVGVGTFLRAHLGAFGLVVQLAIGGAIAAFIAARFAPEAKGHGVPEVMEAVALRGGKMRPRVIAIKALASATTIGFGGSCGREGPIVQIGSTIGSVIGQIFKAPAPIVRTLVACGAAAGISATFNAPIGGVFFASEIILGEFAPRSFAAIVVSSVMAAVIGRAYLGNHPSFNASGFHLVSPYELVLYAILGVLAAVWAWGFVRFLYLVEDRFDLKTWPAYVKGILGFAVVGVIAIWFPQIMGVGYVSIQQVFYQHVPAPHGFILAALKPIATSFTLGGGGSGGVFAPSLFTGAFLGDGFGRFVHALFPSWTAHAAAYGLVGMAAVFAAAAEAPITAITIIFEMSNDYTIILPLMIAVVIATLIGKRLLNSTVYEMKLIRRGIDWQRVRRPRFFGGIYVASVERKPPVVADINDSIAEVVRHDAIFGELAVPVVSGEHFIGIVTSADLAQALLDGRADEPVSSIVTPMNDRLRNDDTLERAATLMADATVPLLAVVDAHGDRLVGIVTRRDVLEAYRSA